MKKLILSAHSALSKAIDSKHYSSAKENSKHLPDGFTVTFHAGALFTKPNTVESIRAALDFGAKVVEFDVSFRPDGTPVIIHASSAKENEGVLLDSALAEVAKSDSCRINLDIKSTANLPDVDKLVEKHGLTQRVFYTGVFEDWVETVRTTSSIPYYLNHNISSEEAKSEKAIQAVAEKIISLGAIGLNSNFRNSTLQVTEIMHRNGLLVSLWTANNPSAAAKVIACLPDNITTKTPHLVKNMI